MDNEELPLGVGICGSEETLVSDLLVDFDFSEHWFFDLKLCHEGEFVHSFVIDLPKLQNGQKTVVSLDHGGAT